MANNDGLDANMNFGHESFEDAIKVPLFEGSTLSSVYVTILILNCYQTHGIFNAFIAKLLALLKKNPTLTKCIAKVQIRGLRHIYETWTSLQGH
jgi:hypothetical protein